MKDISEIYVVGRIDTELYSCCEDTFVTDEVIITSEQLQHIKARHPEAYDNTLEYVEAILEMPDYIIEDSKRNHSVMVLKRIAKEKEHNLLLLRICTVSDPIGYKNSIITSWEISEKRLDNYLRNKKVLYKKE